MKLNKKVIESMTVAASLLVMSTFTAFAGSTEQGTIDVTESVALLDKNGTAGIISELHNMESGVIDESGIFTASIEKTEASIVTAGATEAFMDVAEAAQKTEITELSDMTSEAFEESEAESAEAAEEPVEGDAAEQTAETTPEQNPEQAEEEAPKSPEEAEWENKVMADVEEDMNIRTSPDAASELAGKFYRGDVAEVVSVEGEWTQIASGNVTGYVKNDYLVYGTDANELANEVCSLYATVNADALRLRSEPNEEASIVTTASNGDKLKVDKEAAEVEGWVAVKTSSSTAYVSADYVSVALNLGTALNNEEVAAKEAKEAEKAGTTQKPAMSASVDEVTLLGALIQCEAGNGSYEGMVAVGAVVMNRVRSGAYPGSISGVIYQSGQFPPALNGNVASVMASGVKSSCLQAAQEAINGKDNTNGALSFRSAASGYSGTVIGANVFF